MYLLEDIRHLLFQIALTHLYSDIELHNSYHLVGIHKVAEQCIQQNILNEIV